MDPNANLKEMLELAISIQKAYEKKDGRRLQVPTITESDAARLAELVEALDGWLFCGGFLPKRWAR